MKKINSKYHCGDYVLIKTDLEEAKYGGLSCVCDMLKYRCSLAKIIDVCENKHTDTGYAYKIDSDGGAWSWSDDMIETLVQRYEPRDVSEIKEEVDINKPQHAVYYHVGKYTYTMNVNLAQYMKNDDDYGDYYIFTDEQGRPFTMPADWVDTIVRI